MEALDLTVLGIGAIIGTGIFVLTGVVSARYAGQGVILSFGIAGIASILTALVYSELAAMVIAALLTLLAASGTKESGGVNRVVVLIKPAAVILFLVLG